MSLTLEEAIARVPQWVGEQDIKTSFLAGGMTNQNYRVEVNGEAFVVRLVGNNTELLGVNRKAEHSANTIAGKMGIAPEVIHVIEPENCLVTRFIEGRPIPEDEIGQPENIQRIVEVLKNIHALPPFDYEFFPLRVVEEGILVARQYNVEFPENFDWVMKCMYAIEEALAIKPSDYRMCHNDLLNANFLLTPQDKLFILDWEYAGMNDPYFDLANFATHHEFSDDQDRLLLEAYFGEVSTENWAHLKLMRIVSDFRESNWSMVQIGISTLDYNFREYADKHFQRLTKNLDNPRYEQWLKDVQ